MDRPFKGWTSDSTLIDHWIVTRDPAALEELVLRGRIENGPRAEISPEFIKAVEQDEARRHCAPALN